MRIVLVNPVGVTPDITIGSLVRPRSSPLPEDPSDLSEINIVELARQLCSRGNQTTVLIADSTSRPRVRELSDGLQVITVDTLMKIPFHPGIFPMTPSLEAHPALREADVIQAGEFHQPSTFFSSRAARASGIPLVVWQETFEPMIPPGSWYQYAYERSAGRHIRATARRFIPRTTKASMYLESMGVPPESIGPWIPTGIDLDRFAPGKDRLGPEEFGWTGESRILVAVARLHPNKGVDRAIRMLRRIRESEPNARLLIRGSGPELENLRQLVADLRLADSVRFVERLPQARLPDLYRLADVVVCVSRRDLLPFALIEASACGRPCVTMDVGAARDVVVEGVTGLFAGQDEAEFVRSVVALLRDDDKRREFGSQARKRMESYFGSKGVAAALLKVYHEVAS